MSPHPDDPMPNNEPDLGRLGRSGSSGLGSLAQSARGRHLTQARSIMLIIGTLTFLFNAFMFWNAPAEVQREANQPGVVVDAALLLFVVRLVYGGIAFLGVLFILLGFLVTRFPLPATIIALVLYLGSNAVLALLDPAVLLQGFIFKIIVIVCLVKALQAAIAYQRELRAAVAADEYRS